MLGFHTTLKHCWLSLGNKHLQHSSAVRCCGINLSYWIIRGQRDTTSASSMSVRNLGGIGSSSSATATVNWPCLMWSSLLGMKVSQISTTTLLFPQT